GLLGLGDGRLLQQDNVLEVALQATLDDVRQSLLRLALLTSGGLGDLALLGDGLSRDVVGGQEASLQSSNLHCSCACSLLVLTLVSNEHADCRRQVSGALVQVDSNLVALQGDSALQLQLLTDLGGELLQGVDSLRSVDLDCLQLFAGVCVRGVGSLSNLVREVEELLVLSYEVGLSVDLDHGITGDCDQALGCGALSALADVLGTLDTQDLDGLIEVALSLDECLLAVHHAGAGHLAELLDISSGVVRHQWRPSFVWKW